MKILNKILVVISVFLLSNCGMKEMEFDEERWNEMNDMFYTNREKMVRDLMENHLKTGMTYNDIIELLGQHENYHNVPPNTIGYEIMVDYGWNIDPQKGKTLYIEFTTDSIIKDIRLEKWKH